MKNIFNLFKRKAPVEVPAIEVQRISYAQCGEDLIMDFIFQQLKIDKPTYLDLGAHHPKFLSNTYFFYKRGSRGVNVEPDPFAITEFFRLRPEDKNLSVGVGLNRHSEVADFYIMSARTLNTFSREDALRIQSYGNHTIDEVLKIELVPVHKIIEETFQTISPNFVSIDVEGLDFEITQRFNFEDYRPEVFCIETLTYTENNSEEKVTEIIDFMQSKDYIVFADTFINTIFVDRVEWQTREK